MKIHNEKLKSAFIEAYSRDFDEFDTSEDAADSDSIDAPGPDGKKSCPQSQPAYRFRFTKVGLVAACFTVLLCGFIAVPSIRDGLVNFAIQKFEQFSSIEFHRMGNARKKDLEQEEPIQIPDGYSIEETFSMPGYYEAALFSDDGKKITVVRVNQGAGTSIDTENAEISEVIINGYKGMIAKTEEDCSLVISDREYGYILSTVEETEVLLSLASQLFQ